jgi:NitT/TauT family transport system substrate-binding protein
MLEGCGRRVGRREFLRRGALMGAAGWATLRPGQVAAEPPPETTTIRIPKVRSVCLAPQYVAEELLRAEGFRDVQYVDPKPGVAFAGMPGAKAMGAGLVDIQMNFAAPLVVAVEEGTPIVLLGGIHVGCFELIGTERVKSLKDLKGKSVAIPNQGSAQHIFLASILTQIGLDPRQDIRWDTHPPETAKRLLAEGRIDAFLGFPPDPQELRAKRIGHVLLNSAVDRPWSQYFCCIAAANREFVREHPVATKRALRAIVKASQLCALEPDRVASTFLTLWQTERAQDVRQAATEIPYGRWRDYNAEETVRFYALRLHEAGMVKSSPQKLIAQGTDWRFLNDLKKELKG